ncbi:hypothetical protein P167DRAFT_169797 [Morchella conica CCBAS932]|uniref:Uncharacterized protein n=1 Tax=Morchella conica CCBAS932 TaxID=1392247 RepID=A0A3N4KS39_9PEZI|nr:hypothetical protein P167DRAFT_169797 [Morchella conica CCBAS932]
MFLSGVFASFYYSALHCTKLVELSTVICLFYSYLRSLPIYPILYNPQTLNTSHKTLQVLSLCTLLILYCSVLDRRRSHCSSTFYRSNIINPSRLILPVCYHTSSPDTVPFQLPFTVLDAFPYIQSLHREFLSHLNTFFLHFFSPSLVSIGRD